MKLFSHAFIGSFAHYASQLLLRTLRIRVHCDPGVDPQGQYIYGFWHDQQFIPIMKMASLGNKRHTGLVSTSGDGEMLSVWLKKIGYTVVRGSSSRKAISGVVKLLASLKEGYSVGIAADGPRGPRYEAKSGLAFLAYKSQLKVVPLGIASSSSFVFQKSWDKYQLPKPFAKVVYYFGEPISITDITDIDKVNQEVADGINASVEKAREIMGGRVVVAAI